MSKCNEAKEIGNKTVKINFVLTERAKVGL